MNTISAEMQAALRAEVNESWSKMAGYTSIVSSMSTRETFDILMGYEEGSEESNRCRDIFEPSGELNTDNFDGIRSLLSVFNMSKNGSMEVSNFYSDFNKIKQQTASYFGDMAKRLDAAHAEGKFTDEEYEGLNKMIKEQLDRCIGNVEESKARAEIHKQRMRQMQIDPEGYKEEEKRRNAMTDLERWQELNGLIKEFIETYCKDFRDDVMDIFNAARYGK